jgi:hypothetical protein
MGMDLLTGTDPIASWFAALMLALVVTAVVLALLLWLIRTAAAIEHAVAAIWVHGQRVANNTIHIAALHRTLEAAEAIRHHADRIAGHASALDAEVNRSSAVAEGGPR